MSSPIDIRDQTDPGDEVLRKYRYQHAYGVVLSIGLVTGRLEYIAIWCEQHEDFLAETNEGLFDAYQIKTRKSELGEWKLNDEALYKSIARFVKLNAAFPEKIRNYYFVSNTQFSDSAAKEKEYLSPIKFLKGIKSATEWNSLSGEVAKGFKWLKDTLVVSEEKLFDVLRRLDIVVSLTERAYEDELSQRHISTLSDCSSANASRLKTVCEALIARIAQASSLVTDDPSRDWVGLTCNLNDDPLLMAKRITKDEIVLTVRDALGSGFYFLPDLLTMQVGSSIDRMDRLKEKMTHGGLSTHYEAMRRRALSAERELLDIVTRPSDGKQRCSQIENVVLAECDEANLRASQAGEPFGSAMLINVQDRLKHIAENTPERACRQPYDLLVGVAGLLTSECKVWWSEQFELEVTA